VTVAGNFLDGKGNVTVSMSYENSQKVMSGDRDITSTDATQFPGLFECVGTKDCAFLGGATYSSYSLAGRFKYGVPNANGQIVGGGTSYTVDPNDTSRVFNLATDGFDRNPHRYIQVPVIRRLISEEGHIDIFPWARFFFEGTYAYTSSESQLEPYPGSSEDGLSVPVAAGGTGILIPNGNPFIPPDLAALAPGNSPGL